MSYYEAWLFKHSPPLVQEAMLSGRNVLRKSVYRAGGVPRIRRALLEMERWPSERLVAYQAERLRHLVRFAASEVPHYRDLFARIGLDPRDVRGPEDLRHLPTMDRSFVRANIDRLVARRARPHFFAKGVTTGTTGGTPLVVLRDLSSVCWEEARLSRWRLRAGIRPGERRAVLRGDHFTATTRADHPWLHDRINGLLLVSIYHLSDDLLPGIVARLRQFAPVVVEGYPTALLTLARFLVRTGQRLVVRAVLTSSEMVRDPQRAVMRMAFGADVYDQYGMAERVALASECIEHRLHVDMECSIVEILRRDGTACPPGEPGEIVGTCLTNLAMPLFRYRTGDIGSFAEHPCPCGSPRPALGKLLGRDDDFIVGANGRRFSATAISFPFDNIPCVAESQLVQKSADHLLVRLVPMTGTSEATLSDVRRALERDLQERVGGGMLIDFEIVREIPKGPSGKYRWVVSAGTEPASPSGNG